MLFAILEGGTLAMIVNQQGVRAEGDPKLETGKDGSVVIESGCYGSDERECFTEIIGNKKRIYKGTYQERSVQ